jgi:hypothetical protein
MAVARVCGRPACGFGHAVRDVAGGAYGGLPCSVLQRVGGNLLELLRQGTPPLHGIHYFAGGVAGLFGCCLVAHHGLLVGRLELERIGHVAHVEVHALERRQCHLLHFQRLDGGAKSLGILVQPEMHGFEFFDAFVQLVNVERGRHPVGKVWQLRQCLRCPFGQVLQKIEAGHEFSEAEVLLIAHRGAPWELFVQQLTPSSCRASTACVSVCVRPSVGQPQLRPQPAPADRAWSARLWRCETAG